MTVRTAHCLSMCEAWCSVVTRFCLNGIHFGASAKLNLNIIQTNAGGNNTHQHQCDILWNSWLISSLLSYLIYFCVATTEAMWAEAEDRIKLFSPLCLFELSRSTTAEEQKWVRTDLRGPSSLPRREGAARWPSCRCAAFGVWPPETEPRWGK